MARVSVPQNAIPALVLIAEHGRSLGSLRQIVESIDPTRRSTEEMAKAFAEKAKISQGDARKIITQLMALDQVRTTLGITSKELFEGVVANLKEVNYPDAKRVDLEKLQAAEKDIEAIFSTDHPLGLANKITRLRFEQPNILLGLNIFADVRPVFDDSGRDIKALNVGYMLELEYSDGTDRRQIFAALDAKDIARLKAECERAQTKTLTLKEKFKSVPWPTLVVGELDDE